ncbi:Por secretion system C-terminal sorting domain-containing protein [Flavobacterium resistens]|uniref:Por secretion system C-terminal sorting domain-containing protein n=1 Tax=Flavobacterium resistens TaxID=443612 RepID=A0A521EPX7_9FLAO|nr:T9SS type A sorting domain-containing protein [Flavobacterium resistens]MRX67839.1 T9SS type A sorting domain-containing protein [Flavobacterium resistens]SMO85999.1 Por secretion system C-terminal sorting domain-containing protein [Flavobacterium resistens]
MKIKLLLLICLSFCIQIGFSQNVVTYSPLNHTLNLDSGQEGSVDILVTCRGTNSSDPAIVLSADVVCLGPNDGYFSHNYSNGNSLTANKTTVLTLKFKKIVTADTQIVYKFSTNNNCSQDESQMIKVTVNYKKGASIPNPPSTNPFILQTNNQPTNIYEGEREIITLWGWWVSESDSYVWQKKVGSGDWETIPGENGFSLNLRNLTTVSTTLYQRLTYNNLGAYLGTSNTITITIWPKLSNNIINLVGSEVQGSIPNGGYGGYYYYKWYVYALEGEDPWVFEQSTRNFTIPTSVYNFIAGGNIGQDKAFVVREAMINDQRSYSNAVIVFPAQDISNNNITLSGSKATGFNITGSNPTGGTGTFRYEYYAYNEFDGEVIGEVDMVGTNRDYYQAMIGGLPLKFYRKIYSGNKVSYSNTVTIFPDGSTAKKAKTNQLEITSQDLVVFPNPASESVNFSTNFSTNEEIEIVIYSENLANKKSIFKGKVTSNQVISWNIPLSYSKGLYFYKILSDNKEVKSGKVIFK